MAKILIKTGEFKGNFWVLQGDLLTNGFYKVKQLPLSDLLSLNKKQQLNNLLYAEFKFTNGITFTASMNSELYAELYEVIQNCKQNSKKENTADNNESLQQEAWKKGKVIAQLSQQNILQVIGCLLFVTIFLYGIKTVDLNRGDTLKYQQACIEKIHTLTGYNRSSLVGDGQKISYKNNSNDKFIFRCVKGKVQFYAESTERWMNM